METDAPVPGRWRALALLALGELLGMSLWFTGNAVAPELAGNWALDPTRVGWLTTAVQGGFVIGTAVAALLNLADVIPSRLFFSASATLAAGANFGFAYSTTFETALACRVLTGLCLAGVYPPAMKMAATWFRSRRGFAIGTIVGALTIGKATPYFIHAFPTASAHAVVLSSSFAALIAAVLIGTWYADGPFPFPSRRFAWGLVGMVVRSREWRLATGGYLGHMFELYAFWTWVPAFLAASSAARAGGVQSDQSLVAFATIAVGGAGCVWGGVAADRRGREWLVTVSMMASGACCLLAPAVFGAPPVLVAIVALAWGFFVIADSAQFSALVTESVPPHAVGTALTVQTSIGFLLTMVSIQLIPPIVSASGWRWAFPILALGPVLGIGAIRRLVSLRQAGSR